MSYPRTKNIKKRKFKPPRILSQQINNPESQHITDNSISLSPKWKKRKLQNSKNKNTMNTNNNNTKNDTNTDAITNAQKNKYWSVFYCIRSRKKNKNFLSAFLEYNGKYFNLWNEENGLKICSLLQNQKLLDQMSQIINGKDEDEQQNENVFMKSFEVELNEEITFAEFKQQLSSNNTDADADADINNNNTIDRTRTHYTTQPQYNQNMTVNKNGNASTQITTRPQVNKHLRTTQVFLAPKKHKRVKKQPINIFKQFKNPMMSNKKNDKKKSPKLILNKLEIERRIKNAKMNKTKNETNSREKEIVVPYFLSSVLRTHQRTGVQFMYDCLLGFKNGRRFCGLIVADECGLGKTLQAIVVIYTLIQLKVFRKVLIVVPNTLIRNWDKEWTKFIQAHRMCFVHCVDSANKERLIRDFLNRSSNVNILLMGYEMLRNNAQMFTEMKRTSYARGSKVMPLAIDCMICDEGHRLKNKNGNKTIAALNAICDEFQCVRRCILSGTIVQNNLSELYSICHFVNPGIFGEWSEFKRQFADVIERSRNHSGLNLEKRRGERQAKELHRLSSKFILRRTNQNIKYLKITKNEYIIFHKLSDIQNELYSHICQNSKRIGLKAILYLRLCCCHPRLVNHKLKKKKTYRNTALLPLNSNDSNPNSSMTNLEAHSIKLQILQEMLFAILAKNAAQKNSNTNTNKNTNKNKNMSKIIIVSNFTSVLDIIEHDILVAHGLLFLRLDGNLKNSKRMPMVNQFNSAENDKYLIFLLSSKAGGIGLNLYSSNILFLIEPEWNPSIDEQTIARIYRMGQTKQCKIYRFIACATIEENVIQKQFLKIEYSDTVIDRFKNVSHLRNWNIADIKNVWRNRNNKEYKYCQTIEILQNKNDIARKYKVIKNAYLINDILYNISQSKVKRNVPIIFIKTNNLKKDETVNWNIKQKQPKTKNEEDFEEDEEYEEEYQESDEESVMNMNIFDAYKFKPESKSASDGDEFEYVLNPINVSASATTNTTNYSTNSNDFISNSNNNHNTNRSNNNNHNVDIDVDFTNTHENEIANGNCTLKSQRKKHKKFVIGDSESDSELEIDLDITAQEFQDENERQSAKNAPQNKENNFDHNHNDNNDIAHKRNSIIDQKHSITMQNMKKTKKKIALQTFQQTMNGDLSELNDIFAFD